MITHILLPNIALDTVELLPQYKTWLESWLQGIDCNIEDCNVASSMCLQGILAELTLYKKTKRNWLDVFEDCLTDENGNPIAYSIFYGKRLYKFNDQWYQIPIHAIHTRWWVEKFYNSCSQISYPSLIEQNIQPNGWIYNYKSSPTRLSTRMKSEYRMSFAMGIEILKADGVLKKYKKSFEATLSSEPLAPYLSAEYFRIRALELLESICLMPPSINTILAPCEAGKGYCDFSVLEKKDDYMGTQKRSARDIAVHSPLLSLYAHHISQYCDSPTKERVQSKLDEFAKHLKKHPLDIPAFRIRDLVDIPFGTDVSPLEVIAASAIIQGIA